LAPQDTSEHLEKRVHPRLLLVQLGLQSNQEKEMMILKVMRGSSWGFRPDYARAANRNWFPPALARDILGFRVIKRKR